MIRKQQPTNLTIVELKEKLEVTSSEEIFGIRKQIPPQCPRINNFIHDLDSIDDHTEKLKDYVDFNENRINDVYIKREITIIKQYLETLKTSFEEMRTACEELRARGDEWKDLTKRMFPHVQNNRRFIDKTILKKLTKR